MKFTELSGHDLPGGVLTEWMPRAEREPSRWDADSRPLTYDHESHIRRASSASGQSSWLGATFIIERGLDTGAMHHALLGWIRRHEAFLTTASVTGAPLDGESAAAIHTSRRTVTGADVSLDRHTVGRLAGDDITTRLTTQFTERLSPLQWPHCMVATIADPDAPDTHRPRVIVVFGADHSVMDAYSMLLSINEIRQLYLAAVDGTEAGLAEIGSHADFSAVHRGVGADLTVDHPAVDRWSRFLAESDGDFPALGLPLVDDHGTADHGRPQRGRADFVATSEQMNALTDLCRAEGHTTQTAVIASIALALAQLTGRPRMRATMPMHTRTEPRFLESVGWYVGIGPLDIDLTLTETFTDALAATSAGIVEAKRLSRLPYPPIAQLLGSDSEPRFVLSYLDLRFVPGAADWPEWEARTLRSEARSDNEVYLWVARTPAGVTVSSRYPDTAVADTNVRRLVATACAILDDAVLHGARMEVPSTVRGAGLIDDADTGVERLLA
ncbi:condensation domain-containing protein [Williamsia sterculiae]|uniref:Condensation domain-containing protein n=1 Tax=Williamsia sterculiae TaxID=1344003 RepID=A0A1N7DTD4_9NOCA|nr:condensation domain-containing protein [Williamsia sterculiae]SIR79116.1 Condensation domain-containing protein [Williamsia sterculiae]